MDFQEIKDSAIEILAVADLLSDFICESDEDYISDNLTIAYAALGRQANALSKALANREMAASFKGLEDETTE